MARKILNTPPFVLSGIAAGVLAYGATVAAYTVADTVPFPPVTFDRTTTNITATKNLQGNPCGDRLQKVTVSYSASADGFAKVENLSLQTTPRTITITQELSELSLTIPGLPGGAQLVDLQDNFSDTSSYATFDGTIDYDGPSGNTFNPTIQASDSDPREITTGLSFFNVPTFPVTFVGNGDSQCGDNSANQACIIQTFVQGSVTVVYDCQDIPTPTPTPTPPPPPPASAISPIGLTGLLAFLPLAGVFFFRRRK